MRLSELWLEDLFRIYMETEDTLDRGPLQARPLRRGEWRLAQFGSFDELESTIKDKLAVKRREGAVEVLGYYIRFIHDPQRRRASEMRRRTLRDWIRSTRRVEIRDRGIYNAAIAALILSFREYERSHWERQSSHARFSGVRGDRHGIYLDYSGALEVFVLSISEIMMATSESILLAGPTVRLEVDYEANRSVLIRSVENPARFTAEGSAKALTAWNALQPRQRAALAYFRSDTRTALETEYEWMHGVRGLPAEPVGRN